MLLLLFILLLATPCDAGFASEVDCKNNRCFVLVECSGRPGEMGIASREEVVLGSVEHRHLVCTDNTLAMIVEIDTRSAHRFDYRVFYREPSTELNLTGLVDITSEGATMTLGGAEKELSLTDHSPPRGGDGVTANLSSYRFAMEIDGETNLFYKIIDADHVTVKRPTGPRTRHLPVLYFDRKHEDNMRCDSSDLVDHCTAAAIGEMCEELDINTTGTVGACSNRLWYANASDDKWLWVNGIACLDGYWTIRRGNSRWNVISARFFCGESPPVCESETGDKVLMILLGIYCAVSSIVLVALFVLLCRKMDAMKGRSQYNIVRVSGTRERQPSSGSSSGSSSENEGHGPKAKGANKRLEQKNQAAKAQVDPAKNNMVLTRIEDSRKAKAPKKINPYQKEEVSKLSGRDGETDVDRLKTE